MDNLVSESAEAQIDGLDFSLPTTSMAVTSRRFTNVFPSGSNVYNATSGNKVIRFNISADDNQFLDLSSVRMFAILENKDGTANHYLRPIGGLHSFFSRYTCNVGGQQVQDIIEYGRHCELYDCFKSKDVRDMDDIENSANPRWDSDYHQMATGLENIINPTASGEINGAGTGRAEVKLGGDRNDFGRIDKRYTRHSFSGIKPNGKMRLSHKPCCGLLGSNYMLPLRYAPLQLEFTIVQNGLDPIVKPDGDEATTPEENDRNGWYFQEGNTSTQWEINSVIIRAEMVQLDNTIANNFVSHLLQGGSLKMVFPMYHTITQSFSAGGGEITMQIVKSASKLTGAFITLYRPPRQGTDPITGYYHPDNYAYKRWNYFYNPMINSRINTSADGAVEGQGTQVWDKNLSWQIQLSNAQKYPEFESQSLSETFYYLCRALHYMYPDQDSLSFGYKEYRNNKFIIGMSFEKMPDLNFTGYNSKMSGVTTFKIKGTEGALPANEQIEEVFAHLVTEGILEVRESGSIIFD